MIIIVFTWVIGKRLALLLVILMRLEMTWIWRFLISSAETLVCTNGYYFIKYLLKYPSKNASVTELTSLVSNFEHLKEIWLV